MKNQRCFLLLVVVFCPITLLATIWSVDNNAVNQANFLEISESIASTEVQAGDTLYIAGSAIIYGEFILDKQLILIGPGYFLNQNSQLQFNPNPAAISDYFGCTIDPGAEGSILVGLSFNRGVSVNTHSITVKRCRIVSPGIIALSGDADNCNILNNYIEESLVHNFNAEGQPTGLLIANNYFNGLELNDGQATIRNNTISGIVYFNNSTYYNNIYISGGGGVSGSWFGLNNTIYSSVWVESISTSDPPDWLDCIYGQSLESLFVGAAGNSTDGQWQLAEGSAAIGAGVNGEDCGAFGGSSPYVLSGIPPIPTIYFLEAATTGSTTGGLPIHIKVKSHN